MRVIATGMPAEEIAGLKALFEAIDRDRSGTITAEELREALKMKGAVLRAADLETLMSLIDVDASGTIEYEEVSDWAGLHSCCRGRGLEERGWHAYRRVGEWVGTGRRMECNRQRAQSREAPRRECSHPHAVVAPADPASSWRPP